MKANLSIGDTVVIYLQNPREKIWGMLCDLTAAGANICGIDLSAFEDWLSSLKSGEKGLGLTPAFIPMWRVERIMLDQAFSGIPALEEQVRQRTGLSLRELIQRDSTEIADDDNEPRN